VLKGAEEHMVDKDLKLSLLDCDDDRKALSAAEGKAVGG
jgi:hypothetical protein